MYLFIYKFLIIVEKQNYSEKIKKNEFEKCQNLWINDYFILNFKNLFTQIKSFVFF